MNPEQTPDTTQILAALKAAGITVTGTQIEADSIDIHIDHSYAGFSTDYRAVALGWRPDGQGWYLMPLDPEDESKPAPTADYLTAVEPADVVREVVEDLAYSDEWIASVAALRARRLAGDPNWMAVGGVR